jgi:hypothetical protein
MEQWHVQLANGQVISVSEADVVAMIRQGRIFPNTMVCVTGHLWVPTGSVQRFAPLFSNANQIAPAKTEMTAPRRTVLFAGVGLIAILAVALVAISIGRGGNAAAPSPSNYIPASAVLSPDAERSGGLGLPRSDWEIQRGKGIVAKMGDASYQNGRFWVIFQDERVSHLECRVLDGGYVSLEEARKLSREFIPNDARLLKTYISRNGATVDLYNSTFLMSQFKGADNPWTNGKPGDFIVIYRNQSGPVGGFIIGIGNNP